MPPNSNGDDFSRVLARGFRAGQIVHLDRPHISRGMNSTLQRALERGLLVLEPPYDPEQGPRLRGRTNHVVMIDDAQAFEADPQNSTVGLWEILQEDD